MMDNKTTAWPASRILAAVIALIAFSSLAVQPLVGDWSYIANLGGMLRYFTIWGNLGACVIMGAIALGYAVPKGVMAALATALSVVGLVYWGLLAGDHHPVGIQRVTNQSDHTLVPLATVLWWLWFTPRADSILRLVPTIMVPPLSYGLFSLVVGQLTGFYAYFFVDLPTLGWTQFLLNNAGLALFFGCLGAGLLVIKNGINRVTQ